MTAPTKTPSKKAGRPGADLDKYFSEIRPYLELGYSFHKACIYAQVPYTTLKPYYDDDEAFRNKIEHHRTLLNVAARRNLKAAIERRDVKTSLEWLQAMEKDDFAKRTEVEALTPTKVLITYNQPPRIDGTLNPVLPDPEAGSGLAETDRPDHD